MLLGDLMKKIIIIALVLIVIFFSIYIMSFKIGKTIISVNATDVTSKVVVIDAGHGKPDEGAIGLYGTTEEAINLKIAMKLQELIEQSGGIVYLTRSDENGIYSSKAKSIREKKISDVKNRVIIGNGQDVDIFISIHLNKYPSSTYSGWQTFYQQGNEESVRLAKCIQDSLNNTISKPNNRVPLVLKGVYLMDHIQNTTITVECGFLSNKEEARLLNDDSYQDKLAWGIYIGIQEYFK